MTNEKPASPTTTAKGVTEALVDAVRAGIIKSFQSESWEHDIPRDSVRAILTAALSLPASPTQGELAELIDQMRDQARRYETIILYKADIELILSALDRTTLPPTEEAAGASEQPDFTYYECPECGFDVIHRADYQCRSTACPICAGDSGHDVGMISRPARSTDKPGGKDARLPAPQGTRT